MVESKKELSELKNDDVDVRVVSEAVSSVSSLTNPDTPTFFANKVYEYDKCGLPPDKY